MSNEKDEEIRKLRGALADANSLCRSAHSIAERKGKETNWDAFLKKLKASLALQHAVMYPPEVNLTREAINHPIMEI